MKDRKNINAAHPINLLGADVINHHIAPLLDPASLIALRSSCTLFRNKISPEHFEKARIAFARYLIHVINQSNPNALPTTIKCVLLGKSSAGKTALITGYTFTDEFSLPSTIGVDFKSMTLSVGKTDVKVHLWDTAGQERYDSMSNYYVNNTQVVVCVVNSNETNPTDELSNLLLQVTDNNVVKMAIINTTGAGEALTDEKLSSLSSTLQEKFGSDLLIASTNTFAGVGIEAAFNKALSTVLHRIYQEQKNLRAAPVINEGNEPTKKCSIM
tara:strand:+ start:559 stop:1371 length:813 start_codon:yes stop_codon:yes gene_type:complete